MRGYVTVQAAAVRCGVDERHVRRLIADGTLKAEKFGKSWLVRESSLKNYSRHETMGRPKSNAG